MALQEEAGDFVDRFLDPRGIRGLHGEAVDFPDGTLVQRAHEVRRAEFVVERVERDDDGAVFRGVGVVGFSAAGPARRLFSLQARGPVVLVFVKLKDADDRVGLAADEDGLAEGL